MDIDQEVVREPFEDVDSIRSTDQSPDLNTMTNSIDSPCERLDRNHDITSGRFNNNNQKDPVDKLYNDIDDDEDVVGTKSPTNAEDVKFAKTFGITLGGDESEKIYERLMKSNHVLDKPHLKNDTILKTSVTSDCIYHRGTFYQKGDIVAICDQEDGKVYFAQLTGFLQDQYCEKSASVLWLVPVRPTSRDFFDPSAYRIGLEDTQSRKLDCMTFVRHCPHDYYLKKLYHSDNTSNLSPPEANRPLSYSNSRTNKEQNYIWTTMRPCKVPTL